MAILVGTSGWSYPEWRGAYYPKGLAARKQLEYVAERMPTVELNASFYALQRPTSYVSWYERVPTGFVFAVKGSRFVTHIRRLRDPHTPLANFLASGVLALEDKLGPLLWQFPPSLRFDETLIANFLAELPTNTEAALNLAMQHDDSIAEDRTWLRTAARRPIRHAVEVRHESFRTERFLDLLRANDIALVTADTAGTWPYLEHQTASFGYVRLHGDTELYASAYGPAALANWAEKIGAWGAAGDVYVYFDNTSRAAAPHDARQLTELLSSVPAG
jgi:uncharacterized protein YecE (DUF72 family)